MASKAGLEAPRKADDPNLYVSPAGDDSNPGTSARPLRTFDGARKAVRKLKTTAKGPISVLFAGGTYYLPDTVVFTAEDSGTAERPITYAAVPGAKVVVSGGAKMDLYWDLYRDVMQAAVPEGFTSDQLFVNGVRQPMARYPNYDSDAQYFNGFAGDAFGKARAARWKDPRGGFIHAMHRSHWGDFHYVITGKKPDGNVTYEGGWQNNRKMGMHGQHRFVENIFEELDAPGEWYLDSKKNVLYFYPPEGTDITTATVEAVRLRHLIELRGSEEAPVKFITFRGMTFTHAARTFMDNKEPLLRSDWTTYRGGAVFFNGATDCAVRDSHIDQVGGNAVFVNKYNRRIEVTGCEISDAGASAVAFVGDPKAVRSPLFEYHQTQKLEDMDKTPGPKTSNYPAECLVYDNLIYRNGRVEKQTAGVNISMAAEITVRHNSIYDCPRAGVNICEGTWGGHLIEWNDVFDTVKETGDHGSFNSWGRDRLWHKSRPVVAGWVKQHPDMPKWDCQKTIVIRNNRWRCDHGWDIDLDDGSSNYELYNNLCLAGGIKLREGYFRKVYNNIMVDYGFCPHVWYPDCKSTFERNIIWHDRYFPAGMRSLDGQADNNLVHSPGAAEKPASGLQKFSRGDGSSIVADAMFVDALGGDYRVKEGSPALGLGFKNFPMDRFGVEKPELRAKARTPALPGTIEAAGIVSGGWGRKYAAPKSATWLGAKVRGIRDKNEMSAVGLGGTDGVLLADVKPGSGAERAGLKTNDVILAVNGRKVKGLKEFASAYRRIGKGGELELAVWRDQTEMKIRLRK
jgi:hypothetical protein